MYVYDTDSTYTDITAFDKGERTLIEKYSCFYGLYNFVNLAPPENFSGANDVISMPRASVLLFGVISLDKIVLCYGLLSLLFGGFSSKVEEFYQPPNVVKGVEIE